MLKEKKRKMKKIKLINAFIFIYIMVDILHFFIFRLNTNIEISEAYYESNEMTYIKIGLCLLSLLGLFLIKKSRYANYLILLSSIGMILLFWTDGPLRHLLQWYSAISIWVLFFLGIYLLFLSLKHVTNNGKSM